MLDFNTRAPSGHEAESVQYTRSEALGLARPCEWMELRLPMTENSHSVVMCVSKIAMPICGQATPSDIQAGVRMCLPTTARLVWCCEAGISRILI